MCSGELLGCSSAAAATIAGVSACACNELWLAVPAGCECVRCGAGIWWLAHAYSQQLQLQAWGSAVGKGGHARRMACSSGGPMWGSSPAVTASWFANVCCFVSCNIMLMRDNLFIGAEQFDLGA